MSATEPNQTVSRRRALHLIALGAVIGVPAALLAALFLATVHELQHWLWHDLPERLDASGPPWYLVLGLPAAGACVVLLARTLLPGDGGHGPLGGISVEPTPLSHAPGVALAALGTLAFGAVLGPEAPLIALGSVVGVTVASLARADPRDGKVLSTAGSFSAISSIFGGPLVAGMLLLEAGVGLGAAVIPFLIPGLVAASLGYLIFVGLGDWGGIEAAALSVPGLPPYEGAHLRDLVIAVGAGVVIALLIEVVRRVASGVAGPGRARLGTPVLLVGGGLAAGALALLADGLGANSQDVLFSGQASIPSLVTEDSESSRPGADRGEGARVRRLSRLRLPGRRSLPRDLPRDRAHDARGDRVRRVTDARGRGRCGGRHCGDDAPALCIGPVRRAPRRHGRPRRRPCSLARGRGGLVDDGRDRRAVPGATLDLGGLPIDFTSTDTAFGVFVGLGLSAAAGLRIFIPLLVASAASLTGHLELASGFDWIGTTPALVGFAVAAAVEIAAYLVPFLDNVLDALAAPAAAVAGTVLTASSIVEMSPWLKWSLAIIAGGGIAGTIHVFTGATRLTSTATTGGLANPAVSTTEAGGALGVSILAIAAPILGVLFALLLVFVAVRALARQRLRR